jgi:hypothetical protein
MTTGTPVVHLALIDVADSTVTSSAITPPKVAFAKKSVYSKPDPVN